MSTRGYRRVRMQELLQLQLFWEINNNLRSDLLSYVNPTNAACTNGLNSAERVSNSVPPNLMDLFEKVATARARRGVDL